MHFKQLFLNIYNSNNIQQFVDKINSVGRGKKDISGCGYPSRLSTLISFNFYKNEIVNFKVYCEIFREFKKYEILKFLPTEKDFNYYFKYWNNKLSSSLCFGIKVNMSNTPTQYFHIKLNCILPEFTKTKIYTERPSFCRTGISFEYTENKVSKKYYFYFTKQGDIEYFIEKYNLKVNPKSIDHIEFTEFDSGDQKIIVVYSYKNELAYDTIKKDFFIYNNIKKCVEYFIDEHTILPCYFGIYENSTIALYWSLTENNLKGVKAIDSTAYNSKLRRLLKNI